MSNTSGQKCGPMDAHSQTIVARLVRANCYGTVLIQVARTSWAMTMRERQYESKLKAVRISPNVACKPMPCRPNLDTDPC
jgi:hypothetical protein